METSMNPPEVVWQRLRAAAERHVVGPARERAFH
jgi:hypothetical protein